MHLPSITALIQLFRRSVAQPAFQWLLCGLLASNAFAQSPTFRWAVRAGGMGDDFGNAVAVDAKGNSYVTGSFSGQANFGSLDRTTVSQGFSDVFIAKYNSVGSLIWVKLAGGAADDFGRGVAVDTNGNCYVTGYFFSPTITFGTTTLTRTGTSDLFVAKYDTNGNLQWVRQAGGGGGAQGNAIAVDESGNSYMTGEFFDNLTFDSGTLTNAGFSDVVIAKHDSDGNLLWARQIGGPSDDSGNGIAVDNQGSCYVTGNFSQTLRFGKVSLGTGEKPSIFTAKFSTEGKFIWANQTTASGACYGRGVGVDQYGNSYITGSVKGTLSIGGQVVSASSGGDRLPSSGVMRSGGYSEYSSSSSGSSSSPKKGETLNTPVNRYGKMDHTDILVVRFDSTGRQQWARVCGGIKPTAESGFGIAVDAVGNAYVTGQFSGRSLFGGSYILSSGMSDIFVSQYDRHGNLIWVRQAGGPSNIPHCAYGVALDLAGNAYVTGYFRSDTHFGGTMLRSNGDTDIFVARVSAPYVPARSQ